VYERRWALALLDTSLRRLAAEARSAGRAAQFEALRGCLGGDRPETTYANLGALLGLSESAVKKAVQRLRARYGAIVREEIANTVARPGDVDDELRHLLGILAASPAG